MKKILIFIAVIALTITMIPTRVAYAASAPRVEDVEYDIEDREVNIEFYGRVQWKKNAKVKIYDKKGNQYVRYTIEKDSDDIEVKVKKLKIGKKYKYKITGVKKRGTKGYKTVKGSFYAYDD